jgi:predicted ATPase
MVGREQEIGLLLERWRQARDGDGQVVLLIGEAGIGKSRIIQALCDRLAGETYLRMRYFCSPFAVSSALFPVIEQLTRAAGFGRNDSGETKLAKIETLLAATAEPLPEVVPLFAALCSLPDTGRYRSPDASPQRQRELIFASLLRQLERHAERQPVLLLVEDGHWMDPTTSELFHLVVDRISSLRVLLVITGRPELDLPWASYPSVTTLRLNRLGRSQGAEMLDRVTGGKPLPEEVREQIIAKTDGIPLFVEELTKTVLESGLLRDAGDRYVLEGPLPALAIPATLHDSLMARLDRLASVKEVAQIGAAIGREFAFELISAIASMRESELAAALDQLVTAELVFRRGLAPASHYNFKHALVQDVAYGSLLRGRRQALHRRIAESLERRFPEIVAQQPELLARHYSEANMPAKAVGYRLAAAERAAARSANAEALVHLRRGLDAVAALPDDAEATRIELALLSQLAVVLRITQGYGSGELVKALTRGRELCERVGTTQQLFQVLFGLWTSSAGRGDWSGCQRLGEECLALAGREADPGYRVEAHRLLGTTAVYRGEFGAAREHLEQALALYDPARDEAHARLYGYDPWCICAGYLSWVLWHLGFSDRAARLSGESIAAAERSGFAANQSITLGWAVFLRACMGDLESLGPLADRLIEYATEMGFPQFLALGRIGRGVHLTRTGEPESGIALIRQGSAEFAAAWGGFFVPYWRVFLARALGRAGDFEAGLEALFQAEAQIALTGERLSLAEVHRVRGDLLRWSRRLDEAEASYRLALDVARAQQARSLELRAAISLTELGAAPVTGLLAEAFRGFAEGHDTPDLRAAATLLGVC